MNSIRNYLNENFSGWILSEARQELERRLEQASADYDAILKRLNVLYGKGLFEIDWAPDFYMEGASNLVGLDLRLTREKMRELFRALEEKKRMLELLDRFLEQPSARSAFRWAWEKRTPPWKSCPDWLERDPARGPEGANRRTGADVDELRTGYGGDPRVGKRLPGSRLIRH